MLATRIQRMSQQAFTAVRAQNPANDSAGWKQYRSFALAFPALIHVAGLCQAIAVAQADGGAGGRVLADVLHTLNAVKQDRFSGADAFANTSRACGVMEYMHLTRLAMEAASLVKRYVEVLNP